MRLVPSASDAGQSADGSTTDAKTTAIASSNPAGKTSHFLDGLFCWARSAMLSPPMAKDSRFLGESKNKDAGGGA